MGARVGALAGNVSDADFEMAAEIGSVSVLASSLYECTGEGWSPPFVSPERG
jgi:hypothetical protein